MNIADEEALTHWQAERPDPDPPDLPGPYDWPTDPTAWRRANRVPDPIDPWSTA